MPDAQLVNFDGRPTPGMRFVRRLAGAGFNGSDPSRIFCGGSSGYGALQLAVLRGARQITLFGFDYRGGHHNEAHYRCFNAAPESRWLEFASAFDLAAPVLKRMGVDVVNASPGSAITVFPKCSVEEALK